MTETPRDDKPKPARRPRIKLPFDNRREDVGSWTYDHRIGLCITLIAYLALMIVFVSSKIVVFPQVGIAVLAAIGILAGSMASQADSAKFVSSVQHIINSEDVMP